MISSGCFVSIPLPVTASFGWRAAARLWIVFRLSIDAEIALTASFEGAETVRPDPKRPPMLSWLPHRRARIERIDTEAEALIRVFGEAAYREARRREYEASSNEIARDWGLVALAVARQIGSREDVDPLVRLTMNAVLVPDREKPASREPQSLSELRRADELTRGVPTTRPFRIQYVGAAPDHGSTTLKEVEIQVADVSSAIITAANLEWPPRTIGLRILDREGREVFGREKASRR
jgi:hypothetical protein